MIEQVGASTAAPDMGVSPAAPGNRPYADLTSIGQDATHFGNAYRAPEEEHKGFMGKVLSIGATIATLAAATRIPGVRGMLRNIPGKDKILKMIGEGAQGFLKSGFAKSLNKSIKGIPLIGEKISRHATRGLVKLRRFGRHAGQRIAAAEKAAATTAEKGAAAGGSAIKESIQETGEKAVAVAT